MSIEIKKSNNVSDSDIRSIRTSELQLNKNDFKCAPSSIYSDGSCISLDMLVKMATAYNKYDPNNKIKLNDTVQIMSPNKYKRYLVEQFKKRIPQCDDQKCWVEEGEFMKYMDAKIKKKLEKETFRPYGPTADEASVWLNTTHIDEVMTQYEGVYKDFKYLGTVPIDFAELDYYPMKNIDFNKYVKDGKMRLGTVLNTDTSRQSGAHWIALWINFYNGDIIFSDSYGVNPDKRITDFMRKAGKFMSDELGMKPNIRVSKKRHQMGNSACGMYSIWHILSMLNGKTLEEISAKRIPDEFVNGKRDVFFIKKNKKKRNH